MSTCLGMYIENNIIKYAKVSKEHDQIKVENFGVKFYDNFNETVKQIVEETYSYKIPISTNLSEEIYNYFNVFTLLNKKDVPVAIKTEFEAYCAEKNYNPNVFETRYAITQNTQNEDRLKVVHVSENKIELNKIIQNLNGYRLQAVVPISMSIPSIKKFDEKENALIVNIEDKTTITTILDRNIYDVKVLEKGSQEILEKINLKENSYQKAYEICKETTIYTSEGRNLTEEDTGYLEDIMPTLYDIVGQVRKILNESLDKIEKVYITGTGALINNIDLYFEEYLENVRCEILKPDFVRISPEINIKDYIEVNTAISLALSGLGEGIKGMNFKKTSIMDKLPEILTKDVGSIGKGKAKVAKNSDNKILGKISGLFANDFNIPLDKIEKGMLRSTIGLLILFIVYSAFSGLINTQINKKSQEADESIANTKSQIALVDKDIQSIQSKISVVQSKLDKLSEIKANNEVNTSFKKSIPNLLNSLMYVMPEGVQITSIEHTTNRHIVIKAQSASYSQLGYLTASIKRSGILTSVISTPGQKENNLIKIEIEGDLP